MLTMSGSELIWPPERPRAAAPGSEWSQARSNLCLDFHGDPANAQLVVLSDGNHHMTLAECVEVFVRRSPGLHEVFYTTTPSSVYLAWIRTGELNLGNLTLRVRPNVVIGPRDVVERLHAEGETEAPVAFARSRGNAYLVRAGNPQGIRGMADLVRPDVIPFMSNPETEAASYGVYRETMLATARIQGLDVRALERRLSGEAGEGDAIVFGDPAQGGGPFCSACTELPESCRAILWCSSTLATSPSSDAIPPSTVCAATGSESISARASRSSLRMPHSFNSSASAIVVSRATSSSALVALVGVWLMI